MIPLLVLLFLSAIMVYYLFNDYVMVSHMSANTKLFSSCSRLIHNLQQERELLFKETSAKSQRNYEKQHQAVDKLLSECKEYAKNAVLSSKTVQIESYVNDLKDIRRKYFAKEQSPDSEIIADYDRLIARLLEVQLSVVNSQTGKGIGKVLGSMIIIETAKEDCSQIIAKLSSKTHGDHKFSAAERTYMVTLNARLNGRVNSPAVILLGDAIGLLDSLKTSKEWLHSDKTIAELMAEDTVVTESHEKALLTDQRYIFNKIYDILNSSIDATESRLENLKISALAGLVSIIVFSIVVVFMLFFSVKITTSISRPIINMTHIAKTIATGELGKALAMLSRTNTINEGKNAKSETAILTDAMQSMVNNLIELIKDVKKASEKVTAVSGEISSSSHEQEAMTNELRAATNETAASSNQISQTSQVLIKTIDNVKCSADKAATLATSGNSGLLKMGDTMERLGASTKNICEKLTVMNDNTSNINNFTLLISKVADQTNLLSLNASIEAEKAGEYGKGFSAVAREIRRLSDQVAMAAVEISQMVTKIQSSVSAGVMGMEKFAEDVKNTITEVEDIGNQLEGIIDAVTELPTKFDEVADGMKQQALGAQQINESMVQLNECAKNSSTSAKTLNHAARQLCDAVGQQQCGIEVFKVS
jgi:methyl-accepting chemotaxis protein WspA